MDMTLRELVEDLDPPMTARQLAALTFVASIVPADIQRTGRPGRPAFLYDADSVRAAHAIEANRTSKQFLDNDWIACGLLARKLIRADTEAGELWWCDTAARAEELGAGNYGWVNAGGSRVGAHRILWIAAEGEIPYGIQVSHINKLRWDNRRANLELVTFGNNIRHRWGAPYITYHDAVSELAEIRAEPATAGINPYGSNFTGGRLIAGPKTYRPGR